MKIKELLLCLGLASLVLTGSAFAQKMGPMMPPVDPAKVQEFCKEIQPLYQKEIQLRNEVRTQIWGGNPNWDLLLEKEVEAAKVRIEIYKKAQEKGLPLRGIMGNLRRYCNWQKNSN